MLKDREFTLTCIRYLKKARFESAAVPYGPDIMALMLVDGWHVKRLLVLVVLGVPASAIVTALTTAICKSIDIGLTAGSYALGVVAVTVGTLSFLSAIL